MDENVQSDTESTAIGDTMVIDGTGNVTPDQDNHEAGSTETPEGSAAQVKAALRKMHEATQEAARLRKEMAQLQEGRLAKLEDTQRMIVEQRERQDRPAQPTDEEILAELQGENGAKKTLELIRQGYGHVDRKYAERLAKQEEELKALREKNEELAFVQSDPLVAANRQRIDAFSKKYNVSIRQAADMMKDILPASNAMGDARPAGAGSSAQVAAGNSGKSVGLSAADIAEIEMIRGRKLTADEIKHLNRPVAGRQ